MQVDVAGTPSLQLYCGSSYFLVHVQNLKHANMDSVPWNNNKSIPLTLHCARGLCCFVQVKASKLQKNGN